MPAKPKTSNDAPRSPLRFLLWPFRFLFNVAACCFIAMIAFAFTGLPWKAYDDLGDGGPALAEPPEFIVILGGGGIPSESGLMRTFYGAQAAREFPKARVVIACPGETTKTNSTVGLMREELVMRGVARQRVIFEDKGRHTREQAMNCFKLLRAGERQPAVLLVTSPEHMKRSLLSFRKAGFANVSGSSAQSASVDAELRFKTEELKTDKLPDVGQSLMARYQFWNNIVVETKVLREWSALTYYALLGWI